MKERIIFCFLVSSLLFSIGCYNTQRITRDQFEATPKEELKARVEQADIIVNTIDSVEYRFLKDNYRIQGDTLTGFGVQTIGGTDKRFHGSISLANINSLKMEEFSLTKTIIAAALPFAALGVFILISLPSMR